MKKPTEKQLFQRHRQFQIKGRLKAVLSLVIGIRHSRYLMPYEGHCLDSVIDSLEYLLFSFDCHTDELKEKRGMK